MEARDTAVHMVGYFERVARERPDIQAWAKGLKTAQEWLRLIDTPRVSEQELTAFMDVIYVHRWHTSAWSNMAHEAYQWARQQGTVLPPSAEFFAHESLRTFDGLPLLERARKLVELFKRNTREDPDYEPWQKGLAFTEQWLLFTQSENLTEETVMTLVTEVSKYSRKNCDSLWTTLNVGVLRWAHQLGYADQVRAVIRTVD